MNANWLSPPDIQAGAEAQREIAAACEVGNRIGPVDMIAGVDTSMAWRDSRGPIHAAVAPIAWPSGASLAAVTVTEVPRFPYIPGYLGFREAPTLARAWALMDRKPDLLFVDGHGRAHPRRCGVATHLGVLLDAPAIGVAKSILCGAVEGELGPEPGDRAPLVDRGELVGVALRTRAKARPIYVSVGHRVALETAVAWVLEVCDGRRLPLPIRLAHDAANAARRRWAQ